LTSEVLTEERQELLDGPVEVGHFPFAGWARLPELRVPTALQPRKTGSLCYQKGNQKQGGTTAA